MKTYTLDPPPQRVRCIAIALPAVVILAFAACSRVQVPKQPPPTPQVPPAPTAPAAAPETPAEPASAAAPTTPTAPPTVPAPVLKAIDVYGTKRIDIAWVKTQLGDKIQRLLLPSNDDEWERLYTEIIDAIRAEHKELDWIKLSLITYFEPGGQHGYLTIDVVEKADKARLTFRPAPKGNVDDPSGLIASWIEYEATFFAMLRNNELSSTRVECPAFHCLGDYAHEKLKPYGEKFVRDVPANEARLIRVLKEDKDDQDRGAAAFLLAHIKDGKKLVALMLPMLGDPSPLARNNAMRVLADIAGHHPEIAIPLKPVLRALDGPTTTDRNKAVAIVARLVKRPDGARLHRTVIQQAGPTLIKLLELEQPNNHDFAYSILKQVSGKDLGEHDIVAWKRWLAEQR